MVIFSKFKKVDWFIVVLLLCFAAAGTLLIHSATMDTKYANSHMPEQNLIYYALGFICLFGVALVDYRIFLKISPYIYGLGIILLLGLYVPGLGKVYFNARGWYSIPGINMDFQPAELMKLMLVFTIAAFMGRRNGEQLEIGRDIIPIGLIVGLPFLLVLLLPDLGNAVIFIVILLGMFWIGNIKFLHVLIGTVVVAGTIGLFFYLFTNYTDEVKQVMATMGGKHWGDRIETFLDPSQASPEKIYQVRNSKIAIGSGSLMGEGYMQGTSVHNNKIPVAYSDTIFVVVAEEFGFLGAAVLLMLYFLLIYRLILISMETKELTGSFIIIGIVSMYVFQIFQNVGMLIGLMPVTGITLPFVSYGGTSLLINMISIGLVLSIRIHHEREDL